MADDYTNIAKLLEKNLDASGRSRQQKPFGSTSLQRSFDPEAAKLEMKAVGFIFKTAFMMSVAGALTVAIFSKGCDREDKNQSSTTSSTNNSLFVLR